MMLFYRSVVVVSVIGVLAITLWTVYKALKREDIPTRRDTVLFTMSVALLFTAGGSSVRIDQLKAQKEKERMRQHTGWAMPLIQTIRDETELVMVPEWNQPITSAVRFTGHAQAEVKVKFGDDKEPTTILAWYADGRWKYGCGFDGRRYAFSEHPQLVVMAIPLGKCPVMFWG